MVKDNRLIVITGPTAVGKTDLSISLAKKINGAIISADSMQVYKNMDIGTAKISKEEMAGVDHYLIDILNPNEEFNVSEFVKRAKEAIEIIYSKGQVPIIVGGTAFYIQALLKDVDFSTESAANEEFRRQATALEESHNKEDLKSFLEKYFNNVELDKNKFDIEKKDFLYELLLQIDSDYCKGLHYNNSKRIIRALEYFVMTGKKFSIHNEEEARKESKYNFAYFVINDDRDRLYERINKRVDKMMEEGLLDEVRNLLDKGYDKDLISMQGIGYKELVDFIDEKISLERAIYLIKQNSRHFAKRQLTWFRRETDVIEINRLNFKSDKGLILKEIFKHLKEKSIIDGE